MLGTFPPAACFGVGSVFYFTARSYSPGVRPQLQLAVRPSSRPWPLSSASSGPLPEPHQPNLL